MGPSLGRWTRRLENLVPRAAWILYLGLELCLAGDCLVVTRRCSVLERGLPDDRIEDVL